MIIQKVKALFIFILTLLKRSLCCFGRRRKSSVDTVPLTGVGIVPNFHDSCTTQSGEMSNWNSWEDPSVPKPPQTIEEHIQFYRSQRMGKHNESTAPTETLVDFFQDMTPTIKKQTKLVMRTKESTPLDRLAFNPTSEITVTEDSGELKSWEEAENRDGFWAESDEWNTNEILKAKRKEDQREKVSEKDNQRRVAASTSL